MKRDLRHWPITAGVDALPMQRGAAILLYFVAYVVDNNCSAGPSAYCI